MHDVCCKLHCVCIAPAQYIALELVAKVHLPAGLDALGHLVKEVLCLISVEVGTREVLSKRGAHFRQLGQRPPRWYLEHIREKRR